MNLLFCTSDTRTDTEIEVAARVSGKPLEVIREWIHRKDFGTLGKRRKGQWYQISFAYLPEYADDDDCLSRENGSETRCGRAKMRKSLTRIANDMIEKVAMPLPFASSLACISPHSPAPAFIFAASENVAEVPEVQQNKFAVKGLQRRLFSASIFL